MSFLIFFNSRFSFKSKTKTEKSFLLLLLMLFIVWGYSNICLYFTFILVEEVVKSYTDARYLHILYVFPISMKKILITRIFRLCTKDLTMLVCLPRNNFQHIFLTNILGPHFFCHKNDFLVISILAVCPKIS